jgi:putative ABC transport system permease protein
MRVADQFRAVRHTFSSNRVRAMLTLLGIMIGAGSIVLLAGLLRGGEEALLMTNQRANEADLVRIRRDEAPAKDAAKTTRKLNNGDAETLGASPLLEGAPVASEAQKDVWVNTPKRRMVRMVGAAPEAFGLYRLEMDKGRFIDASDLNERKRVCVVGEGVWKEIFEGRDSIDNATLTLEGHDFTVVGVLAHKPLLGGGDGGFWTWNGKVVLPHTTFDAMFAPDHTANQVYVRLGETGLMSKKIKAMETVIDATVLRRHYGVQNFKIEGDDSTANQERLILTIIKLLLLGTGLLSLFVGGINIMNIMLVTVTERTREIGVRRAVGATPRAILGQFLLEASFIALTGGLIGVFGGMFLSWLIALVLTHAMGQWNLHIEPWSIALGLGLSLFTGIAFGMMPAIRASRLDPVEALRYE